MTPLYPTDVSPRGRSRRCDDVEAVHEDNADVDFSDLAIQFCLMVNGKHPA
jgi:hypothetical protein